MSYPDDLGFSNNTTSKEAAKKAAPAAKSLADSIYNYLKTTGLCLPAEDLGVIMFPDLPLEEAKTKVGKRLTDLHAQGKVIDSGLVHKNASGTQAIKWQATLSVFKPVKKSSKAEIIKNLTEQRDILNKVLGDLMSSEPPEYLRIKMAEALDQVVTLDIEIIK